MKKKGEMNTVANKIGKENAADASGLGYSNKNG